MADYVDGFVIPLPKKHLNASRPLAQKAGEVWRDHGALDLTEKTNDVRRIQDHHRSVKL